MRQPFVCTQLQRVVEPVGIGPQVSKLVASLPDPIFVEHRARACSRILSVACSVLPAKLQGPFAADLLVFSIGRAEDEMKTCAVRFVFHRP